MLARCNYSSRLADRLSIGTVLRLHGWRPSTTWNQVTHFGADVKRVIGALQGSSSLLEVYVERTDGLYQEYTRSGINWIPGPFIT